MRFYLLSITALLLLTGCGSPEATLSPKLSHYATAQKQCSDFLDGKNELTSNVEKDCELFLERLTTANETADVLSDKKLKKGESAQIKIQYSRERNKVQLQYDHLSTSVKNATLAAIKKDNLAGFTLGVAFPGNTYIAPYYDYMRSKAPQFDTNAHYLDYQREESKTFMVTAQRYLQKGKKSKARSTFQKAAEMNNPQAARSTALLYEESDIDQAIAWHQKAVDGGVKASYLNLGRLYEEKGQKDVALTWYLKAAESNDAKAQFQLYSYYLESDKAQALSWLEKASSNGYDHAQYTYALILMQESKTDKAIDLLQQASQNNYPQASEYLGKYYYDLKLYERSYRLLSQSDTANSFYLRAKMLEDGIGTEQDYSLAYTFYSRADSMGKKGAEKDMKRVNTLLSKKQQQAAEETKRAEKEKMKTMIKQCGLIPTVDNIKKKNVKFHIIGTASAPAGNGSFVIYGNDGEDYYVLRTRGIQEDDRVDISVTSTGSIATLYGAEDETRDLYQFRFVKPCILEDHEQ